MLRVWLHRHADHAAPGHRIEEGGLNVTIRDTRGREADAACGQLRARVLKAG